MEMFLTRHFVDLLVLIGYLISFACGQYVAVPIQISSVQVAPGNLFTNVTVTFISSQTTHVTWTLDDGFTPTALNPLARDTFTRHIDNNTNVATVSIPRELELRALKLHIVCKHSSFQIHSEFGISHSTPAMFETVNQYSVIVPRESEIGVSGRGETRFHVFVNTTGSSYNVGYVQAEAHFVDSASPEVNSTSVYSFLPGMWMGGLRIEAPPLSGTEFHADILLNNPDLQKTGGVISISTACTAIGSLITRLDIKKTLYLHSRPGSSAVPIGSLAHVKEISPKTIASKKSESFLLRCAFFGNPSPKIDILKKNGHQHQQINIPSYMTSLPFESTATFQFINVTQETAGEYVCKASNAARTIQTEHIITIKQ